VALNKNLLAALTLSIALNCSADTDYGTQVVGPWHCQSTYGSIYGDYQVLGEIDLQSNNRFSAAGDLLITSPSFNTTLALLFKAQGSWQLSNNRIKGEQITGSISSVYPLLTGFAQNLQKQLTQKPSFQVRLSRIGSKTMTLVASNDSEINCHR